MSSAATEMPSDAGLSDTIALRKHVRLMHSMSTSVDQVFSGLGEALEARWAEAAHDPRQFPEYAERTLQAFWEQNAISCDEIYDWALSAAEIPKQHDLKAAFAQPPLTLFSNERFHIALLFWTTSTTTIHQHSFEGAFLVFEGSSLQSSYSFRTEASLSPHFARGQLSLSDVRVLKKGAIRQIQRGAAFIHSLYHLEQPSVTLIVRTHEAHTEPQFIYGRPGIAWDPFHRPEKLVRSEQLLKHLATIQHPDFVSLAEKSFLSGDEFHRYAILRCVAELRIPGALNRLLLLAGAMADIYRKAMEDGDRVSRIMAARRKITDPKRRMFLALLMTVPSRSRLVEVLKEFLGEEPDEFIRAEVRELCRENTLGVSDAGPTGFVIQKLLETAPDNFKTCFEGSALAPLAEKVRLYFHPLFDGKS